MTCGTVNLVCFYVGLMVKKDIAANAFKMNPHWFIGRYRMNKGIADNSDNQASQSQDVGDV